MNADIGRKGEFSEVACTEAAGWVARLHGAERTPAAEAGFRRWLSESPENARAFEFLTEIWETSGRLRRGPLEQVKSWQRPGLRISLTRAALAASAIAMLAVLGTLLYIRSNGISTGIGEQRTLVLEDGTRVQLNTNTRAIVRFNAERRLVELKKGEASFEVAKHPERPFIVLAGHRQIRALGTSFVVRREAHQVAVTLLEGKIAVSPTGPAPVAAAAREQAPPPVVHGQNRPVPVPRQEESLTLSPGQRVTFAGDGVPELDMPQLEKLTAWQHGQVDLEGTRLADAVAEMNRYSPRQIVIEDARAAGIRVSGVFGTTDTDDFVTAVAHNYRLEVRQSSHEIVLVGQGAAGD